jgi:hypothetical protein
MKPARSLDPGEKILEPGERLLKSWPIAEPLATILFIDPTFSWTQPEKVR